MIEADIYSVTFSIQIIFMILRRPVYIKIMEYTDDRKFMCTKIVAYR